MGSTKILNFANHNANPPLKATQKSQPDEEQPYPNDTDTSENAMDHSSSGDTNKSSWLPKHSADNMANL